ncbi:DUF7147 family protein [Staphylococcus carnosus]|uniref:DUF7147 domain-containing protein n=1 Tax=Staphylococcus carnosus TaxID=1281 RepID=A0AAJ0JM85_STACA|nr:hypothetical protein [Staphylococcus carnosus]KKB24409.1 hypothetical protein VV61_11810 [Staphylococcus carnosus]POA06903.1 hypothetical protein CD153_01730 [Staphylococcus carnosus]QQS85586.1 hypothetical protein I6J04_01985 [Staphylococcus carnosus]QRQ05525.1 hypothetical protein I6J34_02325 [Staphylococcus carnosus]UTB82474.1 hypothetical protein A2I67_03810 [Staphylococcus carnosus]
MKQSFIVLGEGLTDLFEFKTLIEYDHKRINRIVFFNSPDSKKGLSSAAIIMNPTEGNYFQAMYIMVNAFKNPHPEDNKKSEMIRTWANQYDLTLNELDVKSTDNFHDLELYFNYLIGVLRLYRWIPPLQ